MPLALVTGSSTGIGRATALRLLSAGWTVLAGVRGQEAGERLLDDAASPERLTPISLDVTDGAQIARAAERVRELPGATLPGGLDALINNAGIGVGGPLELVAPEDMRMQFEVNVHGQVAVTQALLPALRRARGRIVFISSVGGRVATPFLAPYAASKHAVEALGDALRLELLRSQVQVALVEPGSVATPIWGKAGAEAERLTIPPELDQAYGHVPAVMDKWVRDTSRRGVPPEMVAETIMRALTARRMRARYVVGRDARVMILLRSVLPDHIWDRLAGRALGA